MQDLSKIETCIISLQEANSHWLLLQPNVFNRIQLTQLKSYPKTNTLLFFCGFFWQISEDSFKMYKLCFSVDILNIETFISITNIPPVWKTRDGLTLLQTSRTCTTYCVFHYNDTANSENVRNIHTAWKAKSSVILSHAHKNSQGYDFV